MAGLLSVTYKALYLKDENAYNVLIIDDEHDLCHLLQTICAQKGLNAVIATNLREAIILLRAKPNLIFLDNNLPDGFGLEFMHIIRANIKNCFVVMMTAQNPDGLQEKVLQSGVNYFLLKPFKISSVTNLIDRIAC